MEAESLFPLTEGEADETEADRELLAEDIVLGDFLFFRQPQYIEIPFSLLFLLTEVDLVIDRDHHPVIWGIWSKRFVGWAVNGRGGEGGVVGGNSQCIVYNHIRRY